MASWCRPTTSASSGHRRTSAASLRPRTASRPGADAAREFSVTTSGCAASTTLLVSLLPTLPVPVDVTLALDGRAIAFTLGLSLVAAVLSGLAPALSESKAEVVSALKADARGGPERLRLRNAFVVAQVALSIVLVVGAGLFVRALQRATEIDPGFDPHGVELAALDLSLAGYTADTGPVFARELIPAACSDRCCSASARPIRSRSSAPRCCSAQSDLPPALRRRAGQLQSTRWRRCGMSEIADC